MISGCLKRQGGGFSRSAQRACLQGEAFRNIIASLELTAVFAHHLKWGKVTVLAIDQSMPALDDLASHVSDQNFGASRDKGPRRAFAVQREGGDNVVCQGEEKEEEEERTGQEPHNDAGRNHRKAPAAPCDWKPARWARKPYNQFTP